MITTTPFVPPEGVQNTSGEARDGGLGRHLVPAGRRHCRLLSFGLWRDVQHRGAGSLAGHTTLARRPISASVSPASGVRCSRISLPARYYNATTAPYNPAAMRHPGTSEWYLLHTYDQVRPLGHACAPRRAARTRAAALGRPGPGVPAAARQRRGAGAAGRSGGGGRVGAFACARRGRRRRRTGARRAARTLTWPGPAGIVRAVGVCADGRQPGGGAQHAPAAGEAGPRRGAQHAAQQL